MKKSEKNVIWGLTFYKCSLITKQDEHRNTERSNTMMNMTTITEYEILQMAWHTLLDKWLKEEDRAKADSENEIARYKASKYKGQLDEVEARLKELEELKAE